MQLGPGEGSKVCVRALSRSPVILLVAIMLTQPLTTPELVHPRWVSVPALS